MAAQATNENQSAVPSGFALPGPPMKTTGGGQGSVTGFSLYCEPPAGGADVVRPVIQNFTPTPGTLIAAAAPVDFDITDNSGTFARNMIAVAFSDGTQELAYDGVAFTARYLSGSSVTPTTIGNDSGFHYTLRRTGGWIGTTITVRAFAVDASGNTE